MTSAPEPIHAAADQPVPDMYPSGSLWFVAVGAMAAGILIAATPTPIGWMQGLAITAGSCTLCSIRRGVASSPGDRVFSRADFVRTLPLAAIWMAIGAVRLLVAAEPEPQITGQPLAKISGTIVGSIHRTEVPASRTAYGVAADYARFVVQPSGRPPITVRMSGHRPELATGLRVTMTGRLISEDAIANPGERLRRPRRAEPTLSLAVSHPSAVQIDASATLPNLRQRIRDGVTAHLVANLRGDATAIGRAVLLGDRDAISHDLSDRFRRTGLSHLLAISGLHVGILALVLLWPLNRLPITNRTRCLLFAGTLIAFAAAIQPSVSVVRAVACAILLVLSGLFGHGLPRLEQLAAVLLGFLVWDPRELFAPGLQLSFTATAIIILIRRHRLIDGLTPQRLMETGPLVARWTPAARWLWQATLWSTLLWLATAPILAFHFRWLTPIGVALNVVCLPLLTGIVGGLVASVAASLWVGDFAAPLWRVTQSAIDAFLAILDIAGSSPGLVRIGEPSALAIAGLYGFVAAMAFGGSRMRPLALRGLAVWVAGMMVAANWPAARGEVRLTTLAVGHGVCVLLQSDDGQAVLFDAGSLGDADRLTDRIGDTLRSLGVSRIDAIVISHADLDHFSAVPGLMEQFPVGAVIAHETFLRGDSRPHRALLDEIAAREIPVRVAAAGTTLPLGSARVSFLHPYRGERFEKDNANSLVARVEAGGASVLLPGDLEGEGQAFFLLSQPKPVDVLVAPHHGSRLSNTGAFREALDPSVVIISDSRPAHPDVVAVYEGAQRLDQSEHGAVTVVMPVGDAAERSAYVTTYRTGRELDLKSR